MLTGLANSPEAAHHCFNLLKSAANGPLSWDHFFGSLKQYYMDLRQDGGHSGNFFLLNVVKIEILVARNFLKNSQIALQSGKYIYMYARSRPYITHPQRWKRNNGITVIFY